jgi:hypothetical protein
LKLDPTQPHGEEKTGGWDVSWDISHIIDPNGMMEITINLIHHPFLEAGAFWSKIENALKL